ncbi:MAG: ABC transporter ATP-binding protein, partial [Pyrinomonadaceae bacterium]|nr:ABC transporter ATP-binding protein [Pyrinomonadaceae bacterium]
MSIAELKVLSWPLERAGEALEALARSSSLPLKRSEIPAFSATTDGAESFGRWIEATADWIGLEAEQTETRYAEMDALLRHAGPALIKLEIENEARLLAVGRGRRGSITVISPQLTRHRLSLEKARAALCQKFELPLIEGVDRLLLKARVPRRRRRRAREAILRERLVNARFSDCWLLRLAPEMSFVQLLRRAGLLRRLAAVTCAYGLLYLLWILSWIVVGRGALRGHFEEGWFVAWALLLLSIVPLRLFATWSQGYIVIKAGSLLKQRLLAGALQLDADQVRQQGTGQLLGRVVESDAVEALALSGGFLGLFACLELAFGMFVLTAGAGGPFHALLLLGLIIFA